MAGERIVTHTIKWLGQPEDHDFPAALSYLSLLFPPDVAESFVSDLEAASISHFAAKDILRASGLTPLDASNHHVKHNLKKIADGTPLSPVLLVRGENLIVADGWHRVNAVHEFDEDELIPCKIA
jgi:hypothetical protein